MDERAPQVCPATPFDVAATLLGHDITTVTGAAAARADHRVWDLLEDTAA